MTIFMADCPPTSLRHLLLSLSHKVPRLITGLYSAGDGHDRQHLFVFELVEGANANLNS
jgi:hypothetical protein